MIDPIQFLIAAMLYHPAAPYLAVVLLLGLVCIGFTAFDSRARRSSRGQVAQRPVARAASAQLAPAAPMAAPAAHLAQAAIDRVPVLDPARAALMERLEDVVECLGRAQRVLPDVALARALCIRPDSGGTGTAEIALQPLNRAELDFGVFSYGGKIDLAVMVRPQGGDATDPERHLIALALKKAGVPLIRIPVDASPKTLRACIQSTLQPAPGRARAA
jgi:hypothetical protein